MDALSFRSGSLAATEEFLTTAYTPMRIGGRPQDTRAAVERRTVGGLTLDTLDFGYTMSFDANPLERVTLVGVDRGVHTSGESACGPGETLLVTLPGRPYAGEVREAAYTIAMFDTELLTRAAGGDAEHPVRLTGQTPTSAAGHGLLHATLGHVRHVLTRCPPIDEHPLMVSALLDHLAAVTLATLPHTGPDRAEPTRLDSRDADSDTLRRAMAFIEDNAHREIGLADIAAAVPVTARAVQYAFARHADTTPLAHLRSVRLARAHAELKAAEPGTTTVTEIAARWGFAHPGRFATLHRHTYGTPPATLLRTPHP
ncbi:helix-turn-helix transcriptional regulator [Streptomyces sp. BI20]|uniref:helix-turn-helix transcriptional regulator n=1 Tax=Streptomyces sp. BI20 TaxID=3403460 RepID=UPI003C76E921